MTMLNKMSCGLLSVPAHRATQSGGTLQLFVARIEPPLAPNEVAADPVIYVGGDLGMSQDYALLASQANGLGREVIVLDPRGSGNSQPSLLCPEAAALPSDPHSVPVDDPRTRAELATALGDCQKRLTDAGVDLTAFNLTEMAGDVEDLRKALKIGSWNLMAIGTNGRIALQYLRHYPDHVRAAILDSTDWPGVDPRVESALGLRDAITELSDACSSDAVCSKQTASFADDVASVTSHLNATPYADTIDDEPISFDGGWFLSWLQGRLGFIRPPGTFVPHAVAMFAAGDLPTFHQQLPRLRLAHELCTGRFPNCWTNFGRSIGTYMSVLCSDVVPFADSSGVTAAVGDDPAWMAVYGADPFIDACSQWKVGASDPSVADPVTTDVPTLAIIGRFDPTAGERGAKVGLAGFTHNYPMVAPTNGHQVTGTEQNVKDLCMVQIRDAWLDEPDQPPDTACKDTPFDYDLPLDYNL